MSPGARADLGSNRISSPFLLTETYHMVNNGDPKVMAWSPNGDSFIVEDIDAFSEVCHLAAACLPKQDRRHA